MTTARTPDSALAAVRACPETVQRADAEASATSAVRKTVTALFCDLVGSTAFGERVDAESVREAMGRYHAMAKSVIEASGGVSMILYDGAVIVGAERWDDTRLDAALDRFDEIHAEANLPPSERFSDPAEALVGSSASLAK